MTVYALLTEKQTFFDANSVELTGGKLFVYLAGTTTMATSYTETDGLVANSQPHHAQQSAGTVPRRALCRRWGDVQASACAIHRHRPSDLSDLDSG
jgi:hypothetical protein